MNKKKYLKFNSDEVFFTSDTHFAHSNIIRLCERPYKDVEEMNEALITNWNKVVSPDSHIFHLGDFAFGNNWRDILNRLNGHKHLMLGNHKI